MNEQERRMVEVGYNLSQAYLKAKREGQIDTLRSIIAAIYGFNGIANEINSGFKDMPIGKDLFRIGELWHNKLVTGEESPISGIGEGKTFEEEDFEV
jgi:hypothetical protein